MAAGHDEDPETITDHEGYRLWAGIFVLCTLAAIPLGLGFMFGAGAGWLAFAVVSCFAAIGFNKLYKAAAKE